jgi:hypothetical protein
MFIVLFFYSNETAMQYASACIRLKVPQAKIFSGSFYKVKTKRYNKSVFALPSVFNARTSIVARFAIVSTKTLRQ